MEIKMKTAIDAVNELRGECDTLNGQGLHIWFFDGDYELANADGNQGGSVSLRLDRWHRVCLAFEFYELSAELSHAPWIKGASLAEYRLANKEVLKVENKTDEVDGMVYEINKYYCFTDLLGSAVTYDKLVSVDLWGSEYKFISSSGSSWKHCTCMASEVGTITQAPVKLIDGEAYMFDFNESKGLIGILDTITKYGSEHRVLCMPKLDEKYNAEFCTNIIHLTPAK
jgi:hypothetical protein